VRDHQQSPNNHVTGTGDGLGQICSSVKRLVFIGKSLPEKYWISADF
jgi:hypothetical protein